MEKRAFSITHQTGLHARPATAVVNKASQYQSEIELEYNGKSVNLKSIMGVMSLGVSKGAEVVIKAEGNDAKAALQGIAELMEKDGIGK
jgi:phosphocarrier protein HPr